MADCFVALLDVQPEKERFYNRFRRNDSVVARPAKGKWRKMYDLSEEEQCPANFATVVNTLVWVERATHDILLRCGEAVRRSGILVYSHKLDSAQFRCATKFGWAILNLYEETGDGDLLTHAQHLGEVLVSHQCNDGL